MWLRFQIAPYEIVMTKTVVRTAGTTGVGMTDHYCVLGSV